MFTDEQLAQGEQSPTLGPAYFAAREAARRFMEAFEAGHFEPLIKKFADDFRDKLWSDIDTFLISDTESNLQSEMWRFADNNVKHLLAGEKWAIDKFLLGNRYDCEKIRATVARLVPKELQDARIADLEAEVMRLRTDNEFLRRRY